MTLKGPYDFTGAKHILQLYIEYTETKGYVKFCQKTQCATCPHKSWCVAYPGQVDRATPRIAKHVQVIIEAYPELGVQYPEFVFGIML